MIANILESTYTPRLLVLLAILLAILCAACTHTPRCDDGYSAQVCSANDTGYNR